MTDVPPVETCVVVADNRRERRVLDFVMVAAQVLAQAGSLRGG